MHKRTGCINLLPCCIVSGLRCTLAAACLPLSFGRCDAQKVSVFMFRCISSYDFLIFAKSTVRSPAPHLLVPSSRVNKRNLHDDSPQQQRGAPRGVCQPVSRRLAPVPPRRLPCHRAQVGHRVRDGRCARRGAPGAFLSRGLAGSDGHTRHARKLLPWCPRRPSDRMRLCLAELATPASRSETWVGALSLALSLARDADAAHRHCRC